MRWQPGRLGPLPFLPLLAIAALFVSQSVALWRYRVDYPVIDDWRYYMTGTALPDSLSLAWLFAPANDTVHVTGKLIDWIVLRVLPHDYTVLAFVSFVLFFGGWLVCALAVTFAVARERPVVLFAALLAFLLPLAGSPYWVAVSPLQRVEPAIAYHQMLPVLGIAAVAWLCVADTSRWPRGLASTLAGLLCVVFGLAYNSGGFALFTLGGAIWLLDAVARRSDPEGSGSLSRKAAVISVTGAACLVLHVGLPMRVRGVNPILQERTETLHYTLPNLPEFWMYFFGLFDRSVGSTAVDGAADLRGLAVAATVVTAALGLSVLLARGRLDARDRPRAIVLCAVLLAVVAYAALVTYGRARFGYIYVGHRGPLGVRLYAHSRFMFWWISAILPLVVVAWALVLERTRLQRMAGILALALSLLLLWPKPGWQDRFPTYLEQWSYPALYQRDARMLEALIRSDVARARGGEPEKVVRWIRHLGRKPGNLYRAARHRNATFVDRWGLLPAPETDGQ